MSIKFRTSQLKRLEWTKFTILYTPMNLMCGKTFDHWTCRQHTIILSLSYPFLIKLLSPVGESGQLYLYYKTGIICRRNRTFFKIFKNLYICRRTELSANWDSAKWVWTIIILYIRLLLTCHFRTAQPRWWAPRDRFHYY